MLSAIEQVHQADATNSISDAVADRGTDVEAAFAELQKSLEQDVA